MSDWMDEPVRREERGAHQPPEGVLRDELDNQVGQANPIPKSKQIQSLNLRKIQRPKFQVITEVESEDSSEGSNRKTIGDEFYNSPVDEEKIVSLSVTVTTAPLGSSNHSSSSGSPSPGDHTCKTSPPSSPPIDQRIDFYPGDSADTYPPSIHLQYPEHGPMPHPLANHSQGKALSFLQNVNLGPNGRTMHFPNLGRL